MISARTTFHANDRDGRATVFHDELPAVLRNLPMLRLLRDDAREVVLGSFEPVKYSFGECIVQEGESAEALFVLTAGKARVLKNASDGTQILLNHLYPGDVFGEMGVLDNGTSRRMATVRASDDVEVYRLDRSIFHSLLRYPDVKNAFELVTRHRTLHNFLTCNGTLRNLSAETLRQLLQHLERESFSKGSFVVHQGDLSRDLYFVEQGRLRVYVTESARSRNLAFLRRGDFFGDLALLRSTPRTATVEALTDCKLLRLPADAYARLLEECPDFRAAISERASQYDYRREARVPLDFAEELLPANAEQRLVGPEQTDEVWDQDASALSNGETARSRTSRKRSLGRFPFVAQIDHMDCAAASLTMVCRYFGKPVSVARVRQMTHVGTDGASLRAICHAANELGLAARPVKASVERLRQMPLPAIVHWEGNHWVVLHRVTERHAYVADPALGLRRVSQVEFQEHWTGYAALLESTDRLEQLPVSRSKLGWLWSLIRPFHGLFGQAVGLALIVSVLEMLIPILTQVIVDRVLVANDVKLLNMIVISMWAVLGFTVCGMLVQRYLLSFATVRIDSAALDLLMRRLLALPLTYFDSRRTGDIQRRLEGMRELRQFFVEKVVPGLTAASQLLAALVLMVIYSPTLAAMFLVVAPLYAALMRFSARCLRPTFQSLEESVSTYRSYQIDAIKGIATVKAMGAEHAFRNLMLNQFHTLAHRVFKTDLTVMCYEGAVRTVSLLSMTLFLWCGARQVMDGSLTMGGLVAFNSLVLLANAPIGVLLTMWDDYQSVVVHLNRLDDVLEHEPEQGRDRSRLLPVRRLQGHLRLENVGFRYGGDSSPPILERLSFEVPAGKKVAIVGRSGSGKTTLIKCLAGLLVPTSGRIFYDNVELTSLNYRDLRRQIGFVLQDTYLFDDTLARNIAFGEEPDMDHVLAAARAAHADEFIDRLPLGYDTRVGESGISLSGGQRQRIAIARALYHRPSLLIFDEATSALDTQSERAVQRNLDQLSRDRTVLIIAHRLSTVRHADLILVLEKGRLAEQGSHDELMERRGLYFYLCSQQIGSE